MTDTAVSLADLRARRDTLDQRLSDGWVRINEAEAQGKDVSNWEDFWLSLLGEYEQCCDELNGSKQSTNEGI